MKFKYKLNINYIQIFLNVNSENIPYDAFKYLISEINYGGQVIDDNDLRLLKSLLDRFINSNILSDNYEFINGCFAKDLQDFDLQIIIKYF